MTLPTTKISTAQNNFLAISGQVNHIDAKKVPEELLINLVIINVQKYKL